MKLLLIFNTILVLAACVSGHPNPANNDAPLFSQEDSRRLLVG